MITIVEVPSTRRVKKALEPMRKLLTQLDYTPSLDRVFIKPNMVDAVGPLEAVDTDPVLVEALVIALNEKGTVKEFVIGDGSAYFSSEARNWERLIENSGYKVMIDRLQESGINARLFNVEDDERDEYEWKFGTLKLPHICKTHAYINFAKMKTHVHTTVTLTLKNQKGLLCLGDKKQFHLGKKYENLHEAIHELGSTIQPELCLIDATRALEGSGPATAPGGQTKVRKLNLLMGGTNMVELDNAACTLMGIDIESVSHLPLSEVTVVVGSKPLSPVNPPFIKPELEIKMSDSIYRHTFETCCTGCQMSLSRMFRKIMFVPENREKFIKYQKENPRSDILMGKMDDSVVEEIAAQNGVLIFFGNCTKKLSEKFGGKHIPGCSPDHNEAIGIILNDP